MKISGKKFLLLVLYAPTEHGSIGEPIEGRTRLMKMGFLFEKELKKDFQRAGEHLIALPEFFAWKYGPFSKGLLNDLEFLRNRGYVDSRSARVAPLTMELEEYSYWIEDMDDLDVGEYEAEEFFLTEERGLPKGELLWGQLSRVQRETLIAFKDVLAKASLDRILEYVYKKYKDDGYADKSLIKDKYLLK